MFLTSSNGTRIPAIGLGTSGVPDESELENAIDTAIETGYRHIDTALFYQNEQVIGRTLKKWFKSGKLKREDIFITTKLPISGTHPGRVESFMKKSLTNLQLDYVDLYLIHFPIGCVYEEGGPLFQRLENGKIKWEGKTDHAAIWKEMEEQVDAGRAKSIGLSNYNIAQIETILKTARIKPANLQIEIHVHLQQKEMVEFCHKHGITVVAYSPLGSPGFNVKMKRFAQEHFTEKQLPNMLSDPTINRIAQKYSKSAGQVMLRFLVQSGIGVIPKSVTPKRIKENFDITDFTLDDDDMKTLAELDVGEDARIYNFDEFAGVEGHPDHPLGR